MIKNHLRIKIQINNVVFLVDEYFPQRFHEFFLLDLDIHPKYHQWSTLLGHYNFNINL